MDETQRPEEQGPLPRSQEAVDWWLKKWGRDTVVEGKEPLTWEDVERLIEVNGGTAEGLHLVERDMLGADLRGADLAGASLQGASLWEAKLQGASLEGARISPGTNLEGVEWDPKYISALERRGDYEAASAVYRRLKEWYRGAGMLSIAGEFHYREREASHKAGWQRSGRQFKTELVAAWRRFRGKGPGGALEG